MERLTKKMNNEYRLESNDITNEGNYCQGVAVDKLALLEDMLEDIYLQQETLSQELEKLRSEDKTKSYQFRELMGKKLTNANLLITLAKYGLK